MTSADIARTPPAALPLTGGPLLGAALLIGLGNFLVVLDTTIANVSVPTIAGSLGVSSSQGTWVITAYAVAAILTGWLHAPGSWRWFLLAFWFFHAGATEFGQLFVPGRSGSLRDVALDHIGLLIGLAISWRWCADSSRWRS